MNKARRKKLDELLDKLSDLRGEIEELRDAEEEAFENLPEGLQGGERGEQMEGNIDILAEAADALESAHAELSQVSGGE